MAIARPSPNGMAFGSLGPIDIPKPAAFSGDPEGPLSFGALVMLLQSPGRLAATDAVREELLVKGMIAVVSSPVAEALTLTPRGGALLDHLRTLPLPVERSTWTVPK
jgi:hypothetical protein